MIRLNVLLLVLGCLFCGCEKARDKVENIDIAIVCRSYAIVGGSHAKTFGNSSFDIAR